MRTKQTTFRKSRRAKSVNDFETWTDTDVANTLNTFEGAGDVRATTIVVEDEGTDNTNREKIL